MAATKTTVRPTTAWAVASPTGVIRVATVARTRRAAIASTGPWPWDRLRRAGWRSVRVRIEPIRPSDARGEV